MNANFEVSTELPPLALNGGPKAKPAPYGKGNRFGDEEKKQVCEALDQQTLFYISGQKTRQLRERFAARYGVKHCVACSSGTAALHIALSACEIKPGDEVITAPLTDFGTCAAILYCGAVPIFADVNPDTYTLDPASVEARISLRTKAIVPVHISGAPCDMQALKALAQRHDLWLVEDCAQSYLTEFDGALCGTIGDIGCFSLNDYKHISAGDGGLVVTNNRDLARRAALFSDKCYDREPGARRNPFFLAPNYRISEIQSAVALAQLDKLDSIVERRRRYGDRLHAGLAHIPGLRQQGFVPRSRSSYWFYLFRVLPEVMGPNDAFVKALQAEGLLAEASSIDWVMYLYDVFAKKQGLSGTDYPFHLAPQVEYSRGNCPNAEAIALDCVRLPVSEFYTDQDLAETLDGIRKVAHHLAAPVRTSRARP